MLRLLNSSVFAAIGLISAYYALTQLQHLTIPPNPITDGLGGWIYNYFELEALDICRQIACPESSSREMLPRTILGGVAAWWGMRGLGRTEGVRGYAVAAAIAFLPAVIVACDAGIADAADRASISAARR
ncbi:MAG: hypothetical protein GC152_13665 [Alphaproteobacteria bacterium]|nr:hypothetical protein [Alphaproteobacteria bacterium]